MSGAAQRRLYEGLARGFHAGVYRYLHWLARDPDLAADLTQQTFVQIWRHPPELRGERALKAWVYRVARNEYLQHQRRARVQTVPIDDCEETEAAGSPDPQLRLERDELSRRVRGAVDRLPDACREVIVLHNMDDLSLAEVARVLEIPEGTVKSRRARAFVLLRDMLAREVGCDEMQPSSSEP
jgi:RNA polymerase sigma-70 factor (ECF subfamily)